eukprot:SAG31_NODE_491_length_14923_cov_12.905221_11_plen_159_part_00
MATAVGGYAHVSRVKARILAQRISQNSPKKPEGPPLPKKPFCPKAHFFLKKKSHVPPSCLCGYLPSLCEAVVVLLVGLGAARSATKHEGAVVQTIIDQIGQNFAMISNANCQIFNFRHVSSLIICVVFIICVVLCVVFIICVVFQHLGPFARSSLQLW